jgi:hypothetical protein
LVVTHFPYRVEFNHVLEWTFDEPVEVGDAIRWVGHGVWRVEEVEGDLVRAGLWPEDEPYPARIRDCGPGEWPDQQTP